MVGQRAATEVRAANVHCKDAGGTCTCTVLCLGRGGGRTGPGSCADCGDLQGCAGWGCEATEQGGRRGIVGRRAQGRRVGWGGRRRVALARGGGLGGCVDVRVSVSVAHAKYAGCALARGCRRGDDHELTSPRRFHWWSPERRMRQLDSDDRAILRRSLTTTCMPQSLGVSERAAVTPPRERYN